MEAVTWESQRPPRVSSHLSLGSAGGLTLAAMSSQRSRRNTQIDTTPGGVGPAESPQGPAARQEWGRALSPWTSGRPITHDACSQFIGTPCRGAATQLSREHRPKGLCCVPGGPVLELGHCSPPSPISPNEALLENLPSDTSNHVMSGVPFWGSSSKRPSSGASESRTSAKGATVPSKTTKPLIQALWSRDTVPPGARGQRQDPPWANHKHAQLNGGA